MGDFARTGDERDMRRGLGHYVRTGYGGSNVTTQRFGSTAATAGALGGALAGVASGQPAVPGSPLDPALLAGRAANEVMDAVVEAVRPVDGTQDAEAERAAIRDALSELLTRFPEADLLESRSRPTRIRHRAVHGYRCVSPVRARCGEDNRRKGTERGSGPRSTEAGARLRQTNCGGIIS